MTRIPDENARGIGASIHRQELSEDESTWFLAFLTLPPDEADQLLRDNKPSDLRKAG